MGKETETCDEFPYFPLLPTEIRLKIWQLSIPDTPRLLPSPPVPGLLVNLEARSVYLKAYTPCFRTHLGKGRMSASLSRSLTVHANFDQDMLFFGEFSENCSWHKYEIWNQPFSKYLVEGVLGQIQHLAVRYIDYRFSGYQDTRERLLEMKGLKTLTIAVDDTDYCKWDGDEHWSVHQEIDWHNPLQEFEVNEGDGQWEYKNGIQRFFLELEMNYRGYKAPELKFARINYTYGGLKDCWMGAGDAYDKIQDEYDEEQNEKEFVVGWRMALSESYSRCRRGPW